MKNESPTLTQELKNRINTPRHNKEIVQQFGELKDKKYIVVIDLELTCWDDEEQKTHVFGPQQQEIIEIGCVTVDANTLEPINQFYSFCKPMYYPILSKYCIELTGITQVDIFYAPNLLVGTRILLEQGLLPNPKEFVFASWGGDPKWLQDEIDRKTYPRETTREECKPIKFDPRFINLSLLCKNLGMHGGLSKALKELELEQVLPPHRALTDALSTYKILKHFDVTPEDCHISNEKTYREWADKVVKNLIDETCHSTGLSIDKSKELLQTLSWNPSKAKKVVKLLKDVP